MRNEQVAIVRRFNRLVSQRIGALETSYLKRGRPLGEARVIFEIGPAGAEVGALRERLELDSGYLSRLLRSLERQGLVRVGKDDGDARRRRASLTEVGRIEFAAYDQLSDGLARSTLKPLSNSQRDRLLKAMAEVERLLEAGAVELRIEPPDSDDARWCLDQYFSELARRFETGFDPDSGNPAVADSMRHPAGPFIVARLHGRPVGCGMLKQIDTGIGEIKRMWTAPGARGMGVASRILAKLEDIARESGWKRVRLDTNRSLEEAQAMYRKAGYREIARYNDNPYADYWFEKEL
jgi:DNA-binding MarR family transcriptional regulator/GNAT superfamily N-acetyltransferase